MKKKQYLIQKKTAQENPGNVTFDVQHCLPIGLHLSSFDHVTDEKCLQLYTTDSTNTISGC